MERVRLELNKLINSNNSIYTIVFILILFIVNILFFYGLQSHTIMGDDLFTWDFYKKTPDFIHSVITNIGAEKYRPVFNLFQFILFKLFSGSMPLFFWFNVLFNSLIITLIYFFTKKVTSNNIIAFCSSLLYITSRFSYYSILEITGLLEALCILWLILIIYVVVLYFLEKRITWLYWLLFLNFLIIFTHERFIVLLPFIIAVIYFGPNVFKSTKQKWFYIGGAVLPLLLNLFIKKVIFHVGFLVGTGGTVIKMNLSTIFNFFRDGVLNIIGFNTGPAYLSAVPFSELNFPIKVISYLVFSITVYVFVVSIIKICKTDKSTVIKSLKVVCLWGLLMCPLLLSASITIRQEFRWLYAPYIIFILFFAYLISKYFNNKQKYVIILLFLSLNLYSNIDYKKYLSPVYFISSQKISDSFYDESIKKYGYKERNFIVEKYSSCEWVMPADLFFKPYVESGDFHITYVDSIDKLDKSKLNKGRDFLYRLNWGTYQFIEIKY
jgi:hypothetical protein